MQVRHSPATVTDVFGPSRLPLGEMILPGKVRMDRRKSGDLPRLMFRKPSRERLETG